MDAGAGETLHDEYIGQQTTLDLLTKYHIPLDVIDSFRRNKITPEHFPKLTQSELKCPICPILGVKLELKEHIDQFLESDGVGKLLDEAIAVNAKESELDCTISMQITLFGHLIPPKDRIGKKWKFSTVEAIEGLLIHVKKPGEIEYAITSQKKKALAKKQTF